MKNKFYLIYLLPIYCGIISCTQKADSATEKSDATNVIKEFYRSFEQKDIELMSELMAHDESMLSFGTSLADLHNSWAEWRENHIKQFKGFDSATILSKNLHVYRSQTGHVAWFADVTDWTLVIQDESVQITNIRISGVLEKRENAWKIVQIHASIPAE